MIITAWCVIRTSCLYEIIHMKSIWGIFVCHYIDITEYIDILHLHNVFVLFSLNSLHLSYNELTKNPSIFVWKPPKYRILIVDHKFDWKPFTIILGQFFFDDCQSLMPFNMDSIVRIHYIKYRFNVEIWVVRVGTPQIIHRSDRERANDIQMKWSK